MDIVNKNRQHVPEDQNDVDAIIYNKGFQAGREHIEPSQTTLNKFEDVNKSLSDLTKKIDKIYFCMFGLEEDKQAGLLFMVNEIREQTKKTNGRVTKIENWKAGIVAVVALLLFLVPACIGWFFTKINTLNDNVISHIASDERIFNQIK